MSLIGRTVIGDIAVIGGTGIIGRGVITPDAPPPGATFRILTEDGNYITTEGGDRLKTEEE